MYSYEREVVEQTENTVQMNVGPSHPAMHGTLRVKMEVQGERVLKAEQEIGFLHTGFEKLGEYRTYNQFITLSDRLNYFSPLNNNIGFAIAVEEMLGIETPRRCQVIRTLLCELSRLADHSLCVGALTMDLGAFTSILWTFVEREKLYDVFEAVTGTRLTTSYARVGGVAFDLPEGFETRVTAILDSMERTIGNLRASFYKNRIFIDRTRGIGLISKQDVESYGITGPMARASGVAYDLRKYRPYLIYNELEFDVPTYEEGDSEARYKVRLDEMDQSIRIVRQALKLLEPGPISVLDQKHALPDKLSTYRDMESLIHHFKMIMPGQEHGIHAPITDLYSATEAPNGELGFHLVSDGSSNPWRVRIRPPSFINYPIFGRLMEGAMLADLVAILASFNIIAGELDR
ncbi:MAG TPA: NADH-quinone oxidoreductase subunit D [Fibrobacteres bacterium]|jgi:NADH-quinone oxidoreductase subunit D|nr:NADH-quinone oxidoreductase subunit D [Fibrobacterota bacterium]